VQLRFIAEGGKAGYFFCLATKEVPERKRPDYGSRWRTRRRSAKSSELASLKQQRFLNASLLLPFAVEPKVDIRFCETMLSQRTL
jgi:hypothetical protein